MSYLQYVKARTTARVLRAISDDKSMNLFLTISSNKEQGIGGDSLKKQTKLTRKQYYTRLAKMKESGIITKKHGKYTLTTFGTIVYQAQKSVEEALANFWKLKAIDSLETSDLPEEERQKLKEELLGKRDTHAE